MAARRSLSVCIVVLNEERNLRSCLDSVSWADELIVVDSHSEDATPVIAQEYVDRIGGRVIQGDFIGIVDKKQAGLEACSQDWVLFLDADERVTQPLRREIEAVLTADVPADGYRLNRVTWHLGRWIRHGEWYPDRVLRLFDRKKGRQEGHEPHDRVVVEGRVEDLESELLHYSYRDFADQIDRIQRFSELAAGTLYRDGVRASLANQLLRPPLKFVRCYVLRGGFLDGWPGFVIATASAFHVFAKYAKLRELERGGGRPPQLPG